MAVAVLSDIEYAPNDEVGATVPNGYVYFYEPGTTTLKPAYKDVALAVAHANPARLDENGKIKVYLNGEYRIKTFKADNSTLVRDTDNYNKPESIISGNFNLADNGSFETDSTNDGTPDNVVLTAYTGGTVVRDATDGIEGAACLKFSDGGSGGGFAVGANFFGVSVNRDIEAVCEIKSSHVDVRNLFEIIWYDRSQTQIGISTVYDNVTTNPTSWEPRGKRLTPPANAVYAKWRFYGCHSSAASDGKFSRLDNVIVRLGIGVSWDKGTDVASAATLPAVHDGNYADVTGSVTITAIESQGVGSLIKRHFDSALVLTHHATNLICPGGVNLPVAAGDEVEFYEYAADDWRVTNHVTATSLSIEYGGILSNDTDTDHDINVTAGARADSTKARMLSLAAEYTKQIDATWAAGDDAGGLSSSLTAPANDTWYNIFLVEIGGLIDVLFDTSPVCANGVTDHSVTAYALVESVLTDGSANIIGFKDIAGDIVWDDPPQDYANAAPGTSRVTVTLSVPPDRNVKAKGSVVYSNGSGDGILYMSHPDVDDEAASWTAGPGGIAGTKTTAANLWTATQWELITNTSKQITFRATDSDDVNIVTTGWRKAA